MFTEVLTGNDKRRIRREIKKGKTYPRIAKLIGCARMTVTRFCKLHGIGREVSLKVIIANRLKGLKYRKALRKCDVCQQVYKPRCDARTGGCGRRCAAILRARRDYVTI